MRGRKAGMLPRGNGCPLHNDCFTCPYYDCIWPVDGSSFSQKQIKAVISGLNNIPRLAHLRNRVLSDKMAAYC